MGCLAAAQTDFQASSRGFALDVQTQPTPAGARGDGRGDPAHRGERRHRHPADQTLRDHREVVAELELPMLLMWGTDEKLVTAGIGPWLEGRLDPSRELRVFEHSGHCPMWEEHERFNQLVGDWIGGLSR